MTTTKTNKTRKTHKNYQPTKKHQENSPKITKNKPHQNLKLGCVPEPRWNLLNNLKGEENLERQSQTPE